MTVDPYFVLNADMGAVDNQRWADLVIDCTGDLEVDWKSFQTIVVDNYASMDHSQMGKNAFELSAFLKQATNDEKITTKMHTTQNSNNNSVFCLILFT